MKKYSNNNSNDSKENKEKRMAKVKKCGIEKTMKKDEGNEKDLEREEDKENKKDKENEDKHAMVTSILGDSMIKNIPGWKNVHKQQQNSDKIL